MCKLTREITRLIGPLCLCLVIGGCGSVAKQPQEEQGLERGPLPVASTNMLVASEFASAGDEDMHAFLLGTASDPARPRFVADILEHPDAAWIVDVPIPDEVETYGPAGGQTLPVVTYITYPTEDRANRNRYAFPYHDARYGVFDHMLNPGELPVFSDHSERYPLIILSHGMSAHGIFDVEHAQRLASHGYIVAVLIYGDERTLIENDPNRHMSFLRTLFTKAVLDSILESETFGPHIDAGSIGISGHSFGGFTALALGGGRFQQNDASVTDARISAAVVAAPWVGGNYEGNDVFAFGQDNADLQRTSIPTICFFGTQDTVTVASFILPAMKQLSGPTYVVELVDQPHVFEPGSWQDRDRWEQLFFDAYLKDDQSSLRKLKETRSMDGGNEDVQLFDYQVSGAARRVQDTASAD